MAVVVAGNIAASGEPSKTAWLGFLHDQYIHNGAGDGLPPLAASNNTGMARAVACGVVINHHVLIRPASWRPLLPLTRKNEVNLPPVRRPSVLMSALWLRCFVRVELRLCEPSKATARPVTY